METAKKKILIVDDDSFLLDMYAFKFSQNDFEVYTAVDGVQALEKLKGGLNPDVVMIDIVMPEMDGFEVLEKLRSEKISTNSLKIILSNKSQQSDIEKGQSLGVAGYIVKANSTPAEVIDQVLDILSKRSSIDLDSIKPTLPQEEEKKEEEKKVTDNG
jgi:CheY-like chemotaxis protein